MTLTSRQPRPLDLPTAAILHGAIVRLEPLSAEHLPALKAIAFGHPEEFALTSTPGNEEQAAVYFGTALRQQAEATGHPVAVVLQSSNRVVGVSRLSEIHAGHRRCELGFSWYDPTLFRTGVNLESKLLLLGFAFEDLQLHRVHIQTDTRNLRSQRAIEALGAKREGTLRRHQVAADGYVRDTVVYSITDLDWPEVARHLRTKLDKKLNELAGREPLT